MPAAYVALAANEAEKLPTYPSSIFSPTAIGRLYLSGTESEIDSARDAAIAALESSDGHRGSEV